VNQLHPIHTPRVLRIGAMLYFGATLFFAIGVPLLGVMIVLFERSPGGEDPAQVGFGLVAMGPCTALFYLPLGLVLWLAARKVAAQHPHALGWTLFAILASTFPCMLIGVGLGLFVLLSTTMPVDAETLDQTI